MALVNDDMALDIRSAEFSDISGIRSVATDAWYEAHAPIIGADTVEEFLKEYYDTESFRNRVKHEELLLDVVMDTDDTVAGYVLASPTDDDEAVFNLSHIYVDPNRWREGLGQRLLEHVTQKIRNRGAERIRLGVMAANDRAVEFYEAAGYDQTDEFYDDRIEAYGYTYEKEIA